MNISKIDKTYWIIIFWFKSLFSSINIGISYLLKTALAKFEYLSIFLVIIFA